MNDVGPVLDPALATVEVLGGVLLDLARDID